MVSPVTCQSEVRPRAPARSPSESASLSVLGILVEEAEVLPKIIAKPFTFSRD